jgi:hypothetical protein
MRKPKKTSEDRSLTRPSGVNRFATVEIPARYSTAIGGFLRFSFGGQVQCGVGFMENNERKPLSLPYIFATCPRVRVRAGAISGGFLLKQSKGEVVMDYTACINCRFFAPERPEHDPSKPDFVEGECRRHPPALGIMLIDRHGDDFRHFGEWPKVLGSDWCGDYEPRREADHPDCEFHNHSDRPTAKTA